MPLKPIDYSNTHFYKICCRDLDITDIYVGHTTDFRKRKWSHKSACENTSSNRHNLPVYRFIRDHNGWNNWDMILIEIRSCDNALDAKKVERNYIEQLKATLNKAIPSRTDKEYKKLYDKANKDVILEKKKLYYEANRNVILEKKKLYDKANRDVILEKQKL